MGRRAFLIHGWEGYPEEGWRPWLKKKLEEKSFEVFIPAMPDTITPVMEKWVSHLTQVVGKPDKNCYFIGHSLGCIAILRYLETLDKDQKVGGVVLVAGFGADLEYRGYKGELSSFFSTPINWKGIKKHCKEFVAIHSDDDPYVSIKHSVLFQEKLSADIIIEHQMKHFSGDDNIFKLPSALTVVLELIR